MIQVPETSTAQAAAATNRSANAVMRLSLAYKLLFDRDCLHRIRLRRGFFLPLIQAPYSALFPLINHGQDGFAYGLQGVDVDFIQSVPTVCQLAGKPPRLSS